MKKLLTSKETPVYETINEKGKSSIFLTCDHASYKIPEKLAGLGLQENITETHIGWDIGALDVAKSISHAIDAPLFFTNYSRLVIDCNRPPLGNDSIPESIHGIRIPGNSDLSENELNQRVKEIFDPYHQAIDESISYHRSIKERINLLAVHSFTPVLSGKVRPWPIGITFEYETPFSTFLLSRLRTYDFQPIGENEPYPITPEGDYGLYRHGKDKGIASVLLEIRQDYLEQEDTRNKIIHILSTILKEFDNPIV
jgi:predicted N-formylglutamate amidohydrolase